MKRDILIVDDDKSIRKMYRSILTKQHYSVSEAASGMEGLSLLKKDAYRLILLDLNMPHMTGAETLRRIREKDEKIPVYIITAFANSFFDELKNMREAGIEFQLLKKPIEKSELLFLVENILAKKSPAISGALQLKLYIAGKTEKGESTIGNLHKIFQDAWEGEYSLEVIDVFEFPDLAEADRIIATPTLCKISPAPEKRIIGDLSVKKMVLRALEIC